VASSSQVPFASASPARRCGVSSFYCPLIWTRRSHTLPPEALTHPYTLVHPFTPLTPVAPLTPLTPLTSLAPLTTLTPLTLLCATSYLVGVARDSGALRPATRYLGSARPAQAHRGAAGLLAAAERGGAPTYLPWLYLLRPNEELYSLLVHALRSSTPLWVPLCRASQPRALRSVQVAIYIH
jgi:hypothetical protein